MAILLRIVGILWIAGGLGFAGFAAFSVSIENGDASLAYRIGATIGARLVLTPVWLTGIIFFLLPGWVRKQLPSRQPDTFA